MKTLLIWVLVVLIESGGYSSTSLTVENLATKQDCERLAKNIVKTHTRDEFVDHTRVTVSCTQVAKKSL